MSDCWTLRAELKKRGLTYRQARKLCDIDDHTFSILVNGGQTLPQLAIKVVRALNLTPEQAQVIGKPLNREKWGPANNLPRPRAIDVDREWYKRGAGSEGGVVQCRRVWLDVPAITQWAWDHGIDMAMLYGRFAGCRFNDINAIVTDWKRLSRIQKIEEQHNIPKAVCETERESRGVNYHLGYYLDVEKVERAIKMDKLSSMDMAKRIRAVRERYNAESMQHVILDGLRKMREGERLTPGEATMIADALAMDMRVIAKPVAVPQMRLNRSPKEESKE